MKIVSKMAKFGKTNEKQKSKNILWETNDQQRARAAGVVDQSRGEMSAG